MDNKKWYQDWFNLFYLGVGVFVFAPLLVYAVRFFGEPVSTDSNDWQAFGAVYYGIVIAGLTMFNVALVKRMNDRNANREAAKNTIDHKKESIEAIRAIQLWINGLEYPVDKPQHPNYGMLQSMIREFKEQYSWLMPGELIEEFQKLNKQYDRFRVYLEIIKMVQEKGGNIDKLPPHLKNTIDKAEANIMELKRSVHTIERGLVFDYGRTLKALELK